jgi:PIN domain nuclease of toxin-antitoxin system
VIHLDTHVLVWLYAGEVDRLPEAAKALLESEELAISPMVELELTYLHEVGRIRVPEGDLLDELVPALGIQTAASSFAAVVRQARSLNWTRDPFDRLIAAHALCDGVRLLTADATMREHLPTAVWSD